MQAYMTIFWNALKGRWKRETMGDRKEPNVIGNGLGSW
jgi:hypothetical protein